MLQAARSCKRANCVPVSSDFPSRLTVHWSTVHATSLLTVLWSSTLAMQRSDGTNRSQPAAGLTWNELTATPFSCRGAGAPWRNKAAPVLQASELPHSREDSTAEAQTLRRHGNPNPHDFPTTHPHIHLPSHTNTHAHFLCRRCTVGAIWIQVVTFCYDFAIMWALNGIKMMLIRNLFLEKETRENEPFSRRYLRWIWGAEFWNRVILNKMFSLNIVDKGISSC